MSAFNSELRLEIEGLRDPRRIDLIARRQLGLTEPLPTQVQEYDAPSDSEGAAVRYVRANPAPWFAGPFPRSRFQQFKLTSHPSPSSPQPPLPQNPAPS